MEKVKYGGGAAKNKNMGGVDEFFHSPPPLGISDEIALNNTTGNSMYCLCRTSRPSTTALGGPLDELVVQMGKTAGHIVYMVTKGSDP